MINVRRTGAALACLLAVPALAGSAAAKTAGDPFYNATTPPSFNFDIDPATLKATCTQEIALAKKRVDGIVRARTARTFATVIRPLEDATADLNDRTLVDQLLSNTSTDAKLREASFACENDLSTFGNETNARPDLYAAVAAAQQSGTAHTRADQKLTSLWLVALRRSGAGLSPAARKQFVALSNQLAVLQNDYSENLGNDKTTISLSPAEIAGLPDDFVASFKKDGDRYVVPVNESTYQRFQTAAKNPDARKKYYLASNNIGYPKNTDLLQKAIAVRDRLAHLMGYPTWAAYVLADRMAQTPKRVDDFLAQLDTKLLPRAKQDLATLAALKANDTGVANATIDPWDVTYYDAELNRTQYAVDDHAIAQYFPVDHVESAVFGIYSKLLGVTFAKRDHPDLWYPDVTEWTVTDAASGKYIGEFYLDFFPRDGKYTHFANFPLLPNRELPDGTVRPPLSAIIGNWPRPAPGKPAVLSHDDVETFFHEFGHCMAAILATTPYETLSAGFRQDFVEAPSQMLENWVWDPAILKELSSNVTTGAPLPDDLIAKMRAARYVDNAYFTTRQIMLASIDMDIHSSGPTVDTNAVWAKDATRLTPLGLPAGVHPESQFGHVMTGYDAGYYGYLWSKVYAQDMFTAFKTGGLESPEVGARYRHDILQPAREIEPDPEVKTFLGRPMDPSAFYKEFDEEGKPVT